MTMHVALIMPNNYNQVEYYKKKDKTTPKD